MSRRMGSWPVLLAAGALTALLVGPATSARAHAQLIETSPAHGTVVEEPPSRVELRFNEPVSLGAIEMRSGGGRIDGVGRMEGATLVFEPTGQLPDGTAIVEWRVVSSDGHPIGGTLVFHVRVATGGEVSGPAGSVNAGSVVANALMYVGLLLGGGLALFSAHFDRGRLEESSLHRFSVVLLLVGVVGTLAGLAWQPEGGGFDLSALPTGALPAATVALVGAALAIIGYGRIVPVTFGVGLALLAPAFTGHTRSFGPGWLVVGSDVVHVYAGAVWGGGLLAIALMYRRQRPEIGPIVRRFSRVAGWSLAAVLITGSALAWALHGSWASLVSTDHGRLALAKLGIVLAVAAMGAYNRYRLVPSPAAARSARRLSVTTAVEVAGLVLVLVITGALVGKDPLATTDQPVEAQGLVQTAIGGLLLAVEMDPALPGANEVRLEVRTKAGEPADLIGPPRVVVVAGDVRTSFESAPDGESYLATVDVPAPGDWGIEVRARVDAFTEAVALLVLDTASGQLAPTTGLLVADAVMPAPPGGSGIAAVYLSVTSTRDDQLIEAGSPACEELTLHETVIGSDGVASMLPRPSFDLKAGQPFRLESGSFHLMCDTIGVEIGDEVPLWIATASGERLDFLVPVVSISDTLD